MKLNLKCLYILLFTIWFFGCSLQTPEERLGPLLDQYLEYWNTGEFKNIENVLRPDFELRMTPRYEPETGIESFKENVSMWRKAYPDFRVEVIESFFTENRAALRWEITARNTGEGWHPPTGKSVKVPGMSIFHFKDGKIKDEWIASNNGYWLHQLGFQMKSPFEEPR